MAKLALNSAWHTLLFCLIMWGLLSLFGVPDYADDHLTAAIFFVGGAYWSGRFFGILDERRDNAEA